MCHRYAAATQNFAQASSGDLDKVDNNSFSAGQWVARLLELLPRIEDALKIL